MHPLVRIQESQVKKSANPRRGNTLFRSKVFRFPEDSVSLTRKAVAKAREKSRKPAPAAAPEYKGRGLTEKKDGSFFWQPIVNGKFGKQLVISSSLAAKLA